MIVHLIVSDHEMEPYYAALVRFLVPVSNLHCHIVSVSTLQTMTDRLVESYLDSDERPAVALGVGPYLKEIVHAELTVIDFGESTSFEIADFLASFFPKTPASEFALRQNLSFINVMDKHCAGIAQASSAFMNVCPERSVDNRCYAILSGYIQYDQVARERVIKNSRTGTLVGGQTYAVTNATDLTESTHAALHELYPDVALTIVVGICFANGEPDEVSHSVSIWDKDVKVSKMVSPFKPGHRVNIGINNAN